MRTWSDHIANITPYAKKNQSSPPLAIASHLPPWCPQFCSRRRGAGLQQRWATTPTAGIQRKEFRWGQITSSAIRRPAKWDSQVTIDWEATQKKRNFYSHKMFNQQHFAKSWNMKFVHRSSSFPYLSKFYKPQNDEVLNGLDPCLWFCAWWDHRTTKLLQRSALQQDSTVIVTKPEFQRIIIIMQMFPNDNRGKVVKASLPWQSTHQKCHWAWDWQWMPPACWRFQDLEACLRKHLSGNQSGWDLHRCAQYIQVHLSGQPTWACILSRLSMIVASFLPKNMDNPKPSLDLSTLEPHEPTLPMAWDGSRKHSAEVW